ncbi:MAG: 3-oxoacyl-[acyl-carrier-protein] synthase 2 [Fimbriimonadales bacterium]|nr:MAG: beta-ketoacyl-[acyl-carrier-protein] synthase II [Armatimonadota bacterium]MBV6502828.1 3-oxoacyl-[acyl-carrier-protein] synthase 2 [Fimbriimonadales bacterium]MCE7899182.1 beta-ketoacyl-[acyl-carrier-protein] synthase II [Armatimonadetes bacterium ATM1]MDL1928965.1 beta-ketoacyl-ACP synthase II [Fimbriimonadia bacterium ATM]MBC6969480.1 beta-ketoacyl-[acyl-carrier-protein] synthase II [Armatimonadota bacterium]
MSASQRVVITGLGAVTPLGLSVESTWKNVVAGKNAVGRITHMDASAFSCQIAAEVRDFNPEDHLDAKEARRLSRFIQFAVVASDAAIRDACLDLESEDRDRIGVMIGSGIGGLDILGEQFRRQIEGGPSKVSPFLVPYMIPDMASGYVSIRHDLRGPNSCVVTACSTGANAIGDAAHIIRRGEADVMIAGGVEAPITEIGLGGFCAARAVSTRNDDPEHASRPFDKERDGFVMGEGGGVLVMESYEHAKARNAKIAAELVGYAMTADAFHITQPSPDAAGARKSMELALKYAGLQPEDIQYINAHGTSTPYNDRLETKAIKDAFGAHAEKIMVSSTKSMVGHSLGAAGAIESIVCIKALQDSIVPPTINYEVPDPECDLDYVPNESRNVPIRYAMKNSFGFGGHNVTLIFKKFDE